MTAQLEGKSADRLDAGRFLDDLLAGLPLAPPGLPAHLELLPIGVRLPQVLRSPRGDAPAWTCGLTRGGLSGGQL